MCLVVEGIYSEVSIAFQTIYANICTSRKTKISLYSATNTQVSVLRWHVLPNKQAKHCYCKLQFISSLLLLKTNNNGLTDKNIGLSRILTGLKHSKTTTAIYNSFMVK